MNSFRFKSKPELFCHAILYSSAYPTPLMKRVKLRCIEAFENHEQDMEKLIYDLRIFFDEAYSKNEKSFLNKIIYNLLNFTNDTNFKKRFENPLHRRYESEFGIAFCFNPTSAMLQSVGQVSAKFIYILENNSSDYFNSSFQHFSGVGDRAFADGFGFFESTSSVSEVVTILRENKKSDFHRILMIHSELMWDLKRVKDVSKLDLPERKNPPSLQFAKYISTRISENQNYAELFKTPQIINEFSMFSDKYIYEKPVYADRGRTVTVGQVTASKPRCELGLMLPEQSALDLVLLAEEKKLIPWKGDVSFQRPSENSAFVNQLLNSDCVYISGPSGWSCLYLGAMEVVGNLACDQDRYNYFLSYITYMLAGGLHSMCEVLLPTAATLELIPGYVNHHYQDLYALFKDDPEFVERYEKVWQEFIFGYLKNYFKDMPRELNNSFGFFESVDDEKAVDDFVNAKFVMK